MRIEERVKNALVTNNESLLIGLPQSRAPIYRYRVKRKIHPFFILLLFATEVDACFELKVFSFSLERIVPLFPTRDSTSSFFLPSQRDPNFSPSDFFLQRAEIERTREKERNEGGTFGKVKVRCN